MRKPCRLLACFLLALTLTARPAQAGPLVAAIGAIATTVGSFFATNIFTQFLGRILLSVALSALQRALMPKPREPGIKTKVTQTGGTNPQAFPLLKYATAGTHVCPPMSHGSAGKTPNAFLTYVILLSDVPGCSLSRVMINSQYVTLGGVAHPDYGLPVTGDAGGSAWVKFYDGTQTVADPMLISRYSINPNRPWLADMIGRGSAYAIMTFKYNRELYPSLPRVRFELNGIPLYDPRKDSTVGGSGAHRWANRATWEASTNPIVGAYNVMRGITLTDGSVWGGNLPAEDVPLASWFAGMNECDLLVTNGAGTEPQFRAGFEVSVDEEPADVIDELMKACIGRIAEIGGMWKVRVGPPGLPVLHITDADIVITRPQDFRPFPNFAASYNGTHATYPDPESNWETKEAAPVYNATYEAADQGQRLMADLNLAAVPYPAQVRRIMHASVEEERRFRRHEQTLPPDAAILEPLDAISWTSTANGYVTKVFEVDGTTEDLQTILQAVTLREADAADFSYPGLPAPTPISNLPVLPGNQVVPLFAVSGTSILDATGAARRPAISMTWEPDLADVTGILYEVRLNATGVIVARGSTQDVATGALLLAEGIIAATVYQVRARPVVDRPSAWTAWLPVTTPDTLITSPDLAAGSVSIQVQTIVLGPITRGALSVGTVLATLDLGAIGAGQGWERRLHFEARLEGTVTFSEFVIALERRRRILGGSFETWVVLDTFTIASNNWNMIADSGTLAGVYNDFEYRLAVNSLVISGGSSSGEVLRNIYITAVRVTK